jgi:hypothetical protein
VADLAAVRGMPGCRFRGLPNDETMECGPMTRD